MLFRAGKGTLDLHLEGENHLYNKKYKNRYESNLSKQFIINTICLSRCFLRLISFTLCFNYLASFAHTKVYRLQSTVLLVHVKFYFSCTDLDRVPHKWAGSYILTFISTNINKHVKLLGVSIRVNCERMKLETAQ